jgi:hypothetical protein
MRAMVRPRWLAWVNGVLALCFLAAAAVQWNDPDPARWMAMYGAAAAACLVAGRARWAPLWTAAVGAIALGWGAAIGLGIERVVAPGELVGRMEMVGGPIEETREALGLALIAVWMMVLLFLERRARVRRGG